MFITGIGTAAPPQPYKQTEGWEAVQLAPQFAQLTPRSRAILRKVLTGNNGIDTRRLALESLHEVFETGPDVLHARFARHAPALATQAAERALAEAGAARGGIGALIVGTCTGDLWPGLARLLNERPGPPTEAPVVGPGV